MRQKGNERRDGNEGGRHDGAKQRLALQDRDLVALHDQQLGEDGAASFARATGSPLPRKRSRPRQEDTSEPDINTDFVGDL